MIDKNSFETLINEATNEELYIYLDMLNKEIERSNKAIDEGFEE